MKYVVKPKVGAAHVSFDKRSVAVSVVPSISLGDVAPGAFKVGAPCRVLYVFFLIYFFYFLFYV